MTWYTIRKDMNTYIISEEKHWEHNNIYVLVSKQEAVIIDCGTGVTSLKEFLKTRLPKIKKMSLVLTHAHWDHIGNLAEFDEVYLHHLEIPWLTDTFPLSLDQIKHQLTLNNQVFPPSFQLKDYHPFIKLPTVHALSDNDRIRFGDRELKVIHTPGHSPGSLCFYEASSQSLFSGDLIYEGELHCFYPSTNPKDYLKSLKKIAELSIKNIYPAHHQTPLKASFADNILKAFISLEHQNKLSFGSGVHNFNNFSIKI